MVGGDETKFGPYERAILAELDRRPTVGDFVPGFEATALQGIGTPKDAPAEIVDKLNKEINAGFADPRLKARFADLGATVFVISPADFGKFIADETEKSDQVCQREGGLIRQYSIIPFRE
jgi:tripartite-type tricarboxylate transporter receptor subunit TctC